MGKGRSSSSFPHLPSMRLFLALSLLFASWVLLEQTEPTGLTLPSAAFLCTGCLILLFCSTGGLRLWFRSEVLLPATTISLFLLTVVFLALAFLPTRLKQGTRDWQHLFLGAEPSPNPREGGVTPEPSTQPTGNEVTGSWLDDSSQGRQLQASRPLQQSNRPEVYFWPKRPRDLAFFQNQTPYLRSFTLESVDSSGTWHPQTQPPEILRADSEGQVLIPQTKPKTRKNQIQHEIYYRQSGDRVLAVTLPNLASLRAPFLRRTGPARFRLPPLAKGELAYRYMASSSPLWLKNLTEVPSSIPRDATLPRNFPLNSPLEDLVRGLPEAPLPFLRALQKRMAQRFSYQLEPTPTPGLAPLANFLQGSQEGYCEHFAITAALAARAVGLRSRTAYGWAGGQFYPSQKMFVLRGRDAHAWCEVFLGSELGWIIVETTPPEGIDPERAALSREAPPEAPGLTFTNEEGSEDDLTFQPGFAAAGTSLVGALCLLGFQVRRQRSIAPSRFHHRKGSLPSSDPPYLATLKSHHPLPPGQTLRRYFSQHPELPDLYQEIVTYHDACTYGSQSRSLEKEKDLHRRLKAQLTSETSPKLHPEAPSPGT